MKPIALRIPAILLLMVMLSACTGIQESAGNAWLESNRQFSLYYKDPNGCCKIGDVR